jgi:hypothetical protein
MKRLVSLPRLLSAVFFLALTGLGSAQTVVRIGGAQAFGDAVHRAIAHVLGATGAPPYTLAAGSTYAYTGTDINKAQKSVWTGTVGGNPVVFETSFTGSTDGVRVVAKNVNINFLKLATSQSQAGTASAPDSTANWDALPPDAAAVDSFQGSTVYNSPTLVDKLVGAGAYVFVASKEAPAALNNITTQLAQALYNTGNLPLAAFTASATDRTTLVHSTWGDANLPGGAAGNPVQVYATGRDYGSGARIVTFIETGIGANANVQQYRPVISGGATTTHALYPAATVNGIFSPAGSDGNSSNGNLATTVLASTTLAGIGGYYISYLPSLDAANAVAAGAHALAYNGTPYSPANVAEGSYSLWAYEHVLYKNTATTEQKSALDTLANQLLTADATLLISALKVSRPIDGGIITTTY